MAVYSRVLAPRPLLVRLIMHMAGETGIRVVLEVIGDLVGDEDHGKGEYEKAGDNNRTAF
jgi:hypothetical protein